MNQTLTAGTVLQGKAYTYTIEKVLGQGSFGITYLATFAVPGPLGEITAVAAVKEFFAKDLDSRLPDGSVSARTEAGVAYRYARAFRRESENLSKMKHPGIVHVLEAFEANGTYYYSMEYLSGGSLDEKVKGVGMPEAEALPMIARIGEALSYMHSRKMIHLDLKPKNIMLKRDGSPVVIDFGLSKQFDDRGEPESSSTIGLGTPGYAPVEQANQTSGKAFQPTLDIYALGATLYKTLTGSTPPVASSILEDGFPASELEAKHVSFQTIEAIREAMRPSRKERPQSVSEFLALLALGTEEETEGTKEIPIVEPEPAPEEVNDPIFINGILLQSEPEPEPKPEPKPGRKSGKGDDGLWRPKAWPLWLIGGLVAILMSVIIISQSLPASLEDEAPGFVALEDVSVDLGLPSRTLWKVDNEVGYYTYESAVFNFGDRLPSKADWEELKSSCRWEWTVGGYRVIGPNGKTITLPAQGWSEGGNVKDTGTYGHYWSSTPYDFENTWSLYFGSRIVNVKAGEHGYGFSVRLVLKQ